LELEKELKHCRENNLASQLKNNGPAKIMFLWHYDEPDGVNGVVKSAGKLPGE